MGGEANAAGDGGTGAYLDDLLVGHAGEEDVLLVVVGVKADDVGGLAVAEALETLAGLGVPELHLTIVAAGKEAFAVVGKGDVLDGLDVAVERAKTIAVGVHVPELERG